MTKLKGPHLPFYSSSTSFLHFLLTYFLPTFWPQGYGRLWTVHNRLSLLLIPSHTFPIPLSVISTGCSSFRAYPPVLTWNTPQVAMWYLLQRGPLHRLQGNTSSTDVLEHLFHVLLWPWFLQFFVLTDFSSLLWECFFTLLLKQLLPDASPVLPFGSDVPGVGTGWGHQCLVKGGLHHLTKATSAASCTANILTPMPGTVNIWGCSFLLKENFNSLHRPWGIKPSVNR